MKGNLTCHKCGNFCCRRSVISGVVNQQGFKACMGILRFEKSYGKERLEAACKRACALGTYSYKSIESILKNNLENKPLPGDSLASSKTPSECHEYVRGQNYYQ